MEFTIEEILDRRVCNWCSKKNCAIRNKIVDMTCCKDLEFDNTKHERHDALNSARMKILLAHAFFDGDKPNNIDDKDFQEWARETYQNKKIHV